MSQVVFNNGVTFAAGQDILSSELQAVFDQSITSAEYPEWVIELMGYTKTKCINPDGTFSSILGTPELSELTESQALPELPIGRWPKKWYQIKEFGDKIKVSKLMFDWLKSGQSLQGADSTVKQSFAFFSDGYKSLVRAAIKSKNFEATKVLTKWWENTAPNGPGSSTAYGNALFSASHVYKNGLQGAEQTFRNILGGSYGTADAALSSTTLQHMLNMHKSELKLYSGDRVAIPNEYLLVTSRLNGTNARTILNTNTSMVGKYSGVGSNAMQLNSFDFEGNKVGLLEHPVIGATDKHSNLIGGDDMYFLLNTTSISDAKALRAFELNNGEINMWYDDNTNTHFVSYYESLAFDHFGLETYVTGSRGA